MKIADLMTPEVHACRLEDNLSDVANLFWTHDCGAIPVLDVDRVVVGMITDRDACLGAFFQMKPLNEVPVAMTMTRTVQTCVANESLTIALERMAEHRVRRLPVVDKSGKLEGVISLGDIARFAATQDTTKEGRALADGVTRSLASVCLPHSAPQVKPKARVEPAAAVPKPKAATAAKSPKPAPAKSAAPKKQTAKPKSTKPRG